MKAHRPTVILHPITRDGDRWIQLEAIHIEGFEKHAQALGAQPFAKSTRYALPHHTDTVGNLFAHFKGIAWVDYSRLRASTPLAKASSPVQVKRPKQSVPSPLMKENEDLLTRMRTHLEAQRYAANTVATYMGLAHKFLVHHQPVPLTQITEAQLEAYHQHEVIQRGYSQAYHNQVINALKHLLYQCPEAALHPEALARPRKQKRLPTVLAKAEVKQILDAIPNPKHRLILSLTYACGLRRAEVLALTPKDIDGQRHMLHIRQSKGAKDRMVPLPPSLVPQLRTHYQNQKPQTYLIEGPVPGKPYSASSMSNILKRAVSQSCVAKGKKVTLHTLRHSYPPHLMEKGSDLRIIQVFLDHSSSTIIEIYTHVSNHTLETIESPWSICTLSFNKHHYFTPPIRCTQERLSCCFTYCCKI